MVENCNALHQWFNGLKRFSFINEENFKQILKEIPKNGVYILFEKGESGHSADRIVRIGTHTGKDQLRSRLSQHFLSAKKDRSIFRKNIGRALLNKAGNLFLEKWEIDLTTKNSKKIHPDLINSEKQEGIEREVTEYIRNNFSFVVFRVDDKDKRLKFESKLISTISFCNKCKNSSEWLGLYCPNKELQSSRVYSNCCKILRSGLWNVQHTFKEDLLLSDTDMIELKRMLNIE